MAFTTKGQKPVVLVWRLLGWCRPPSCKTNKKAIDCIGILLQKGYFTLRKNKQFCPVSLLAFIPDFLTKKLMQKWNKLCLFFRYICTSKYMLESILLWSWYYAVGRLDIFMNSLWSVLLACLKVPFDFHEKTFKNG